VIGILQWVALSGWLLATLGLAPLFLYFGVAHDSTRLCNIGVWLQQPVGVTTVSIAVAVLTTIFLTRGLKAYVRCQNLLFILTVAGVLAVVGIFYFQRDTFAVDFNKFVLSLGAHLNYRIGGNQSFLNVVKLSAGSSGLNLQPPFSLLATLGAMPIAWTSLQWATFSVQQNTEIKGADRFWNQVFMLIPSAVLVAVFLIAIGTTESATMSPQALNALSALYGRQVGDPTISRFLKEVFQPFPNVLAIAAAKSAWLVVVISLGFIANAFQVTCNCFIGVTRILVAMSTDRMLPGNMALEQIDVTRRAPIRAHWAYLIASIPFILGYNFFPGWKDYETLLVTFSCGYVFLFSCLAATRIPEGKMRGLWMASDLYRVPGWVFKVCGLTGVLFGLPMVGAYLLVPELGLGRVAAMEGFLAILVVSAVIYGYATYRFERVAKSFTVIPYEAEELYK